MTDRTVVLSAAAKPAAAASTASAAAAAAAGVSSASATQSNTEDADSGDEHKRAGNDAFARGDWSAAIASYGAAIDAPVSYHKLFDEVSA